MNYRNLGSSGLRVSCLGLGARGTFGAETSQEAAEGVLSAAYENGVTLFDVAGASGRAEKILGSILRSKGWRRSSYVITTRVFWGGHAERGVSRKQILEALRGSLRRLQLDYVDVVFAGARPGPAHSDGPDPTLRLLRLEELVRGMSHVVEQGLALYWGTAGGPSADLMDTYAVARQLNLVAPVCQRAERPPQPNLYRQLGLGAVTWSPVTPGPGLEEEEEEEEEEEKAPGLGKASGGGELLRLGDLQPLAQRLGCSTAQLAIAWCLRAEGVSSVLVGAGSPRVLQEQLQALQVLPQLSSSMLQELDNLLGEA